MVTISVWLQENRHTRDGDTISVNSIMSEEANQEVEKYYNSLGSLVDLNGSLLVNLDTDLTKWITFNLTRDPSMA